MHPSDLSTGFLQNGHIFVLIVIHLTLASSFLTSVIHFFTISHGAGGCKSSLQEKQNFVPQLQVTSLIVELNGLIILLQLIPGQ